MRRSLALLAVLLTGTMPVIAQAQSSPDVVLSLDEAVQLAFARSYAVRGQSLEMETARLQVREAYGTLLPQVDISGGYTRNVMSPNPFAGSDAGGIFGALGALDWLAYNEGARTDGNPNTQPLSFEQYQERRRAGQEAAGASLSANDNPFAVPNQFQATVSITQPLYSGVAFAAVRGARTFLDVAEAGLTVEQHQVIHQTRQAFYSALLAQERVSVLQASVARARATARETALRVSRGTLPVLSRLSSEVEVGNLETELIQAAAQAESARENLLLIIGLPVSGRVRLAGTLAPDGDALFASVAAEEALLTALDRRPDLRRAQLGIDIAQTQRDIERAGGLPRVNAVANLSYQGNVPDNRQVVMQRGGPFEFDVQNRNFFDGSYWNPAISVGVALSWTPFDGFQRRQRIRQRDVEILHAELALEQATEAARLEVQQALRDLTSARQRIASQSQNVERAEMAYGFAIQRLESGVATALEVRESSSQLDQTQLSYLQAVHDLLVARSNLERAIGVIEPNGSHRAPVLQPWETARAPIPTLPVESAPATQTSTSLQEFDQ